MLKKNWWKIVTVLLIFYTIIAGMILEVPRLAILNETIRNLYFHVPMWFGMVLMTGTSAFYAIRHLKSQQLIDDIRSEEFAKAGVLFGVLGMLSGMLWAQFTWGSFWSGDPKQNASAVALMIYFGYFVLRGAFTDRLQRSRISGVYNIFAYALYIPLIFILPRLTDSLHPGNGGNPGFNAYDLDSKLRTVFYPAVIGWILLGVWVTQLRIRLSKIELKLENR